MLYILSLSFTRIAFTLLALGKLRSYFRAASRYRVIYDACVRALAYQS